MSLVEIEEMLDRLREAARRVVDGLEELVGEGEQ